MNATSSPALETDLSKSLRRLGLAVLRRAGALPPHLPSAYATPAPLARPDLAPPPVAFNAQVETQAALGATERDPSTGPVRSLNELGGLSLTPDNVEAVLDEMVRPALNADGGDIQLVKIEGDDIYVKLVGACSSCPSSIMTMKMGVERLLQDEFPDMGELISVDGLSAAPSAWD